MRAGRSKDFVAACALAGALGLGAFLLLRSRGFFGTHWTDGERSFASETGDAVRHAVWDAPEPLDALGDARDPALSPDGRWLVFASGERGLNCELYAAELIDGVPGEPRPLAALDTGADELAPAFDGAGFLYFASDRPGGAGGLDLWRARYEDGTFGRVEALAAGINSAADETDPAPQPGTRTLVFASDRARPDFDLYAATPEGRDPHSAADRALDSHGAFHVVEPLAALNSPAEERGPAFASDGRSLYFASDRDGGLGGLDLYRALCFAGGWQAPEHVPELSSARSELDPWVASDGFALVFEREDEQGDAWLERARSLELFAVPPAAVTLAQWLTLAALLFLALLALLAKRWHALDVFYKCVLVSLVVHLLLMLYLRTVEPEGGRYEPGLREEAGPIFRVRTAAPEAGEGERGPGGPAILARERFAPEAARAEAPELAALEMPERALESAPKRAQADLTRAPSAAPDPELAAPSEAFERYAAHAPGLELEARTLARESRQRSEPARIRGGAPELGGAVPEQYALQPAEAAPDELARGAARGDVLERAREPAPPTALAAPREALERAAGAAPELALRAAEPTARDEGGAVAPARARFGSASAPVASTGPAPGEMSLVPAPAAPVSGPPPERLDASELSASAAAPVRAGPALRAPSASALRPLDPRPAFDATAGLAPTSAPLPRADALAAPARQASALPPATAASAPPTAALDSTLASAPREVSIPTPERARAPTAGPLLADATTALRAPAPEPARASGTTRAEPRFDALAGLAQPRTAEPLSPAAPERALLAPGPADAARPAPRALEAAPPDEPAAPPVRAPLPRLAETPYQNRFGAQKLRALEEFGGTAETEHAVAAGLAYLARIQNVDGAFGQRSDAHEKYLDVRIGKSGLALLAFLGAGHVPGGDGEHAAVAERTVRYLLAAQDPETGHFGRSCSYGHGIATYALAECYALTQAAGLRAPLERGVEEILRNQSSVRDPRFFGGWGYYFADGHVWNGDEWPRTSVTAWQVMALESAVLGGLAVPAEAFTGARQFLLQAWDARRNAFRYDHDPERLSSGYPILPASTPAALFALSLLDVDARAPELAEARRFVLTRAPDGYRYTGDDDFVRHARGNLYFWYYATLALFRVGGNEWEHWNAALKATLLPAQDEDGSWQPLDVYSEYAGDEDDERAYSTAMCVLSLEIYYRYFTPLLQVR